MTMRIFFPPIAAARWKLSRRTSSRQVCRALLDGRAYLAPWQQQSHRRPAADFAADRCRTARLAGEAVNHAKSETGALVWPLCREERLEGPRDHVGRHASAGVGNLQTDEIFAAC